MIGKMTISDADGGTDAWLKVKNPKAPGGET
jgi:hypothetical protein